MATEHRRYNLTPSWATIWRRLQRPGEPNTLRKDWCRRQWETTALFFPRNLDEMSTHRNSMACNPATTRRLDDSRSRGVKYATGHTGVARQAQSGQNATGDRMKPSTNQRSLRKTIALGTWNVRGMIQLVKKETIDKEQLAHKLDILGLSETHMRGSGFYKTSIGHTIYFSGPDNESSKGVAISVTPEIEKCVLGYNPVSDRIITLKLNTKPCRMNIIQVYAPTSGSNETDIEAFYNQLDDTYNSLPKREVNILMGDLNAKVGCTEHDNHLREVVGRFGLGVRNDRGDRWLQFCAANSLSIMNTWFQHHPRRLYTWTSPGDRHRNQIDYIAVPKRWKSSVMNTKTYPGADCDSDHSLLVAFMVIKLKKCYRLIDKQKRRLTPGEQTNFKARLQQKLAMEEHTADSSDVDENWRKFKELLLATHKESQVDMPDLPRRSWLSDETWEIIKEKKELLKKLSNKDSREQYKALAKELQRQSRKDKNQYINNICTEIEDHAQKMHTRDLFVKIKSITRDFKAKTWAIEDADGGLITEVDKVVERWRGYCEDLYANATVKSINLLHSITDIPQEPNILKSEIECALKKLKHDKSAGSDCIFAENLKLIGDDGICILQNLCNQIWKNGKWISDWQESILVPLHKKGSTKSCGNYRTVALISHASKILLYIINERLKAFLQWQIPVEQAGFVKGRGTREQIVNVRQIMEKCREFNIPILMCFVDYSKAFDFVRWECLWNILREMGVPEHLVILIANLYQDGSTVVKVNNVLSRPFKPQKGVRQGCILSPILFNIYGEYIMRRALDGWEGGISIGGKKISNLRYADDTTLFAASEQELAELLSKVEKESELAGLTINKAKTKVMVVDRFGSLIRSNELRDLEFVDQFVYLGSLLTNEGGSDKEICRRIQMSKAAMTKLTRIWKDRNISRKTKVRLVRTLIFSIFSYGAESWTIRKSERAKIDAFEMWCWRRMLRIPWTARRTNSSILKELNINIRLSAVCFKRILKYFGHVARRNPESLEKLTVIGQVDGKRPRGRSPTRWSDQVKALTGLTITKAIKIAEDRNTWKSVVHQVIQSAYHEIQPRHDLQQ